MKRFDVKSDMETEEPDLPQYGEISPEMELEAKNREKGLGRGFGALMWCLLQKRNEQLRAARAGTHKTALQAKEDVDKLNAAGDALLDRAQKAEALLGMAKLDYAAVLAQKEAATKALEEEERAHMQTIGERDDAEEALSNAYAWVADKPAEWSNCFSYTDATNEIAEVMQRLRAQKKALEKELAIMTERNAYASDMCEQLKELFSNTHSRMEAAENRLHFLENPSEESIEAN